eukprot:tig00020704_g13191.t1
MARRALVALVVLFAVAQAFRCSPGRGLDFFAVLQRAQKTVAKQTVEGLVIFTANPNGGYDALLFSNRTLSTSHELRFDGAKPEWTKTKSKKAAAFTTASSSPLGKTLMVATKSKNEPATSEKGLIMSGKVQAAGAGEKLAYSLANCAEALLSAEVLNGAGGTYKSSGLGIFALGNASVAGYTYLPAATNKRATSFLGAGALGEPGSKVLDLADDRGLARAGLTPVPASSSHNLSAISFNASSGQYKGFWTYGADKLSIRGQLTTKTPSGGFASALASLDASCKVIAGSKQSKKTAEIRLSFGLAVSACNAESEGILAALKEAAATDLVKFKNTPACKAPGSKRGRKQLQAATSAVDVIVEQDEDPDAGVSTEDAVMALLLAIKEQGGIGSYAVTGVSVLNMPFEVDIDGVTYTTGSVTAPAGYGAGTTAGPLYIRANGASQQSARVASIAHAVKAICSNGEFAAAVAEATNGTSCEAALASGKHPLLVAGATSRRKLLGTATYNYQTSFTSTGIADAPAEAVLAAIVAYTRTTAGAAAGAALGVTSVTFGDATVSTGLTAGSAAPFAGAVPVLSAASAAAPSLLVAFFAAAAAFAFAARRF